MEGILKAHRIMGIVDGSVPRPAAAGKDQDNWDAGDNEAYTAMLLTMADEEVDAISSSKTAREVWTKLATMFMDVSGESKNMILTKYYTLMGSPDKSPVKTMIEIQNLAAQLRSMGVTISEQEEVCRVVTSLPDAKFRYFVEAWRSVDETKQTTALLLTRLKTWELEDGQNYHASKSEDGSQQKAYSASSQVGPGNPRKNWRSLKKIQVQLL